MIFAHYEDPIFEQFGGVYVPYATLEEAQRQIANDLTYVNNDIEAIGFKSIFEADYGAHPVLEAPTINEYGVITPSICDYNNPTGHLNADDRKIINTPDQAFMDIMASAQIDLAEEEKRGLEAQIMGIQEAIRTGAVPQASVPGPAYSVCSGGTATGGAIALTAATAKTVIGLAAGANGAPAIVEAAISFDGVTASAVPVLVETVSGTNASNPPGTASTAQTPKQIRGWPAAAAVTSAAYNWTTEPTVLEVFKKRLLTPNGGVIILQFPLNREPSGLVTAATQFKFIGIRLTAPAGVNCHVDLEFEE